MSVTSKRKSQTLSQRAGVAFPAGGSIKTQLRSYGRKRVSPGAAVAVAAALEYITAELMNVAGDACDQLKAKRLAPLHILRAVAADKELKALFPHDIAQGGVLPFIHNRLKPKKSKPRVVSGKKYIGQRSGKK